MRICGGPCVGTTDPGAPGVFTIDDIIGKTLFALSAVPIKRVALDSFAVAWTVPPGQAVGVVDTYFLAQPGSGRTNMWWGFLDVNQIPFYAEHVAGRFDLTALVAQGVQTTEQKIQAALDANKSLEDKIIDALKSIAILGVIVFAGVQLLPKLFLTTTSKE